jgi:hypothetical protein
MVLDMHSCVQCILRAHLKVVASTAHRTSCMCLSGGLCCSVHEQTLEQCFAGCIPTAMCLCIESCKGNGGSLTPKELPDVNLDNNDNDSVCRQWLDGKLDGVA